MFLDRRRRGARLSCSPCWLGCPCPSWAPPTRRRRRAACSSARSRSPPGKCGSGATGSYFRMILPTGTLEGPVGRQRRLHLRRPHLHAADAGHRRRPRHRWLPARADPGLRRRRQQPRRAGHPTRPVLRRRLLRLDQPHRPPDGGRRCRRPPCRSDGGKLSGDLSAFAATWNDQAFNQGSPKPGGARPGNTTAPSGTFDPATGAFTLTWTSQIVGGPFNNFTGLWHLEGTFVAPRGPAAAPAGGATADHHRRCGRRGTRRDHPGPRRRAGRDGRPRRRGRRQLG